GGATGNAAKDRLEPREPGGAEHPARQHAGAEQTVTAEQSRAPAGADRWAPVDRRGQGHAEDRDPGAGADHAANTTAANEARAGTGDHTSTGTSAAAADPGERHRGGDRDV